MGLKIGDQVCIGGNKVIIKLYLFYLVPMFIDLKWISSAQTQTDFCLYHTTKKYWGHETKAGNPSLFAG